MNDTAAHGTHQHIERNTQQHNKRDTTHGGCGIKDLLEGLGLLLGLGGLLRDVLGEGRVDERAHGGAALGHGALLVLGHGFRLVHGLVEQVGPLGLGQRRLLFVLGGLGDSGSLFGLEGLELLGFLGHRAVSVSSLLLRLGFHGGSRGEGNLDLSPLVRELLGVELLGGQLAEELLPVGGKLVVLRAKGRGLRGKLSVLSLVLSELLLCGGAAASRKDGR
mmetsp:Transcript_18726/g.40631  ORF Transcript_18726/g.40631 Transcript_18726/m.40631 type:complete len:220 (+) Transcript_18726:424-1083(+)